MPRLNQARVANWLVSALTLGTLSVCVPRIAHAHFHLDAPPSWAEQDPKTGDPQKSGPCGEVGINNTPVAVPTNIVTPFQPGQTISVTITETIMHPGHYRVALAADRSMLPADPPVTAGGGQACGSTVIDSTPDAPVLVDGALVHTSKLTGAQTIQVTLPTNITCTKCTLQVTEFMSSHPLNNPGGCFYHHCADISIQAGGGGSGGGAASTGGSGGTAKGGAGGTTQGGTANASGGAGGRTNGGSTATGGAASGGTVGAGGTTAIGGTPATGGATGAGGSNVGTGGTTSTGGGASTGGTSASTGGITSSGGSTLSGGVSAGGVSAGSTNAGAGAAPPTEDAGCGCAVPGRAESSLAGIVAGLALGGVLLRRRRR